MTTCDGQSSTGGAAATNEEVDVLQTIARMLRPAPPVEVARPASRPRYEGMTTAQYLAVVRAGNIVRELEELGIRAEMVRVEKERARIAKMKADTEERECIRSSRFVTTKEK